MSRLATPLQHLYRHPTGLQENGVLCVQSGAGIVADSVPEKEYQECLNKAKAVVNAIHLAEGGLDK